MRFRRLRISGSYIFQEKRRGNHVNHLEDRAHERLKGFLKPISDACIYLPVDMQGYGRMLPIHPGSMQRPNFD
jgi:hypothetical protein